MSMLNEAYWCLKEALAAAHEAAGHLETEEQFSLVIRLDKAIGILSEVASDIPEED